MGGLGTAFLLENVDKGLPAPCRHLQRILKADFGVLVPAAAAEQAVGIGVRGARGPVVTFLPFGDRGCKEQEHNKVRPGFIKKSSLLDGECSHSVAGLHPRKPRGCGRW